MSCLKKFKEKYLGKQVEYHSYGSGAYNQCVDLVNLFINECLDNKVKDYTEIIGANAKDFKDKFDPEDFDFIANETTPNVVPERGDIVIWNGRVGGGAGHVAIILEAGGMEFTSLDQNWSQVERVTVETHDYKNVSGWLRPKGKAPECPESPLQLDVDIPTEVEDEYELKSKDWYSKYWTFDEFITDSISAHGKLKSLEGKYEDLKKENKLNKETIEQNAETLKNLREDIKNLQKTNKDNTIQMGLMTNQIKEVNEEKNKALKDKGELEVKVGILETKIDTLEDEVDVMKEKLVAQLKGYSWWTRFKSLFGFYKGVA